MELTEKEKGVCLRVCSAESLLLNLNKGLLNFGINTDWWRAFAAFLYKSVFNREGLYILWHIIPLPSLKKY